MSPALPPLLNIPTTLISGFLGVGKTSAVLSLLQQKPVEQKWAVLVNEFGSVGLDGAIYRAHGVEVKEVPGGCMCCAAGAPLQVAVNQLLKQARPQRLIIETSGMGHPKRILDTLSGEHFRAVLKLQASICLVDPQKLLESRYTGHENFIDQVAMADILVANKIDLASDQAMQAFNQLAEQADPAKSLLARTRFGRLDAAWLDIPPSDNRTAHYPAHHSHHQPDSGQRSDGYQSHGWVYPEGEIFNYDCLLKLFQDLCPERIKAVMHTDRGWTIFNGQSGKIDTTEIETALDSRLEIINPDVSARDIESTIKCCSQAPLASV